MSLKKILNSLENSWERDDVLLMIKNGLSTDEIVNDFLINNKLQVQELSTLLKPQDIDLLKQVEVLSTCEAKLLNKINHLNYLNNNEDHEVENVKIISLSNIVQTNRINLFMINWCNRFVFIALITISAIALSKQAWA